jgi:L-lactate dehydrogenase complex protein LldG
MYARLATRPGLFAVSQLLAGLGARLVSPSSAWMKLPAFTGWGYSKDFPRPAVKPFRARFNREHRPEKHGGAGESKGTKVFDLEEEKGGEETTAPEPLKVSLVGRFSEELLALGGNVVVCGHADLTGKIVNLLRERNIDRVQAWDQIPGVDWTDLTGAGISVQHEADETVKAGITGALAGIAETGTLVIPSGSGQPLSASLLPEVHLAVLRASDIEENLAKVLNLHKVEKVPSVVLVSGPSRTADIEMTLTIGVHGPGELHTFVIY